VKEAGNRAALRGRDPQVGAACIENDLEGLGRGTDFNFGEVLDGNVRYRCLISALRKGLFDDDGDDTYIGRSGNCLPGRRGQRRA
jgi:hypothetical protein